MKKIISLVILVLLVFMSCDINNLVDNATDNSATDNSATDNSATDNSATDDSYMIEGRIINLIANYSSATLVYNYEITSKSSFRGIIAIDNEVVIAVSEIPGIGTVVKTENGKYYLEDVNTFNEIMLPAGTTTLHIYQFSKYGTDIYYGVDNKLYKEPFSGFDNNFNGTVIVDGQIFSDTGNLITELQYVVSDTGEVRYNTRGVSDGVHMDSVQLEWDSNGTATVDDDTSHFNDNKTSVNFSYAYCNADGNLVAMSDNTILSYDVLVNGSSYIAPLGFNIMFFGQNQELNNVAVYNRIDSSNPCAWTGDFSFPRDTMFHSYRDHQVYFVNDNERKYIELNSDGDDVVVKVHTTSSTGITEVGTFNVNFETVDTYDKLIPNMWVDTNNDVYIIVGNKLYKNTITDGYENITDMTAFYTHGSRLDAVTVLPRANVNDPATIIVMDEGVNWYNTDGSPYTGANIVAEY